MLKYVCLDRLRKIESLIQYGISKNEFYRNIYKEYGNYNIQAEITALEGSDDIYVLKDKYKYIGNFCNGYGSDIDMNPALGELARLYPYISWSDLLTGQKKGFEVGDFSKKDSYKKFLKNDGEKILPLPYTFVKESMDKLDKADVVFVGEFARREDNINYLDIVTRLNKGTFETKYPTFVFIFNDGYYSHFIHNKWLKVRIIFSVTNIRTSLYFVLTYPPDYVAGAINKSKKSFNERDISLSNNLKELIENYFHCRYIPPYLSNVFHINPDNMSSLLSDGLDYIGMDEEYFMIENEIRQRNCRMVIQSLKGYQITDGIIYLNIGKKVFKIDYLINLLRTI